MLRGSLRAGRRHRAAAAPAGRGRGERRGGARRALLAERGLGAGARWSRAREELAGEARFQAAPRADREGIFRAYVAEQDVRAPAPRSRRPVQGGRPAPSSRWGPHPAAVPQHVCAQTRGRIARRCSQAQQGRARRRPRRSGASARSARRRRASAPAARPRSPTSGGAARRTRTRRPPSARCSARWSRTPTPPGRPGGRACSATRRRAPSAGGASGRRARRQHAPSAGGRGAQGRASNPALDDRELTGLFREHVDAMHQRAVTAFTDLLDEVRPPGRSRRAGRARLRACGAHDLSRWRARPGLLARR